MGKDEKSGRDFLIYIGIGLALVAFVGAVATYTADHDLDTYETMPWAGFGLMTPILFGCVIKNHWAYRNFRGLWAALSCLLVAHLATGVALILRFERIQLTLFVIVFFVELGLISAVLRFVLRGTGKADPSLRSG